MFEKEAEEYLKKTERNISVKNYIKASGFSISQLKGRDYLWKEIVLPKEIENA